MGKAMLCTAVVVRQSSESWLRCAGHAPLSPNGIINYYKLCLAKLSYIVLAWLNPIRKCIEQDNSDLKIIHGRCSFLRIIPLTER